MSYAFYYNIASILVAYAMMLVLGYLMHRFVRRNLRGASNTQKRTLEIQRQITRILIIQVRPN